MVGRGVDGRTSRLVAEQCESAALRDGPGGATAGGLAAALATPEAGGLGMPGGAALGLTLGTLAFGERYERAQDAVFHVSELGRSEASR
jgi:hypothetical protein